jgi:glutamyl-Q tRNA(Asp) synthetase
MSGGPVVGRFAPSPTGPLHLGSLLAAVGSFLFARAAGGRWLLRVEDLDTPRVVPGSEQEILAALRRYGMEWDGAVIRQSERSAIYEAALRRLREGGHVYDCGCSRAELLRLASAPAAEDPVEQSAPVYPGICREGLPAGKMPRAVRFRTVPGIIRFDDMIRGVQEEDVARVTGDFVIRRADGLFAYQLAVVVDDATQGVNQVVRGGDLLDSTARQIVLQRALGYEEPAWAHLPLLVGSDGRKIGKRSGALPLPELDRDAVVRSLRLVLEILGCQVEAAEPRKMLEDAIDVFDVARIRSEPAIALQQE